MFERFCDDRTVQPNNNMKWCRMRVPSLAKVLAAGLAMFYFAFSVAADRLDQWNRRNPLPTAGRLYGVAYGNNSFVGVWLDGAFAVTTNASTWTSHS